MNIKAGIFKAGLLSTALAILMTASGMNVYGWSVSGTVKSSLDGAPLSGVSVTVKDSSSYSITTDENGGFSFESPVAIRVPRITGCAGSYSAQVAQGELTIRSPRDEKMKLSLANTLGRTVWSADVISSQGIAKVALPPDLRRGTGFLVIRHTDGTEYRFIGWGLGGNTGIVSPRLTIKPTAAAAAYPTILFKKSGYHDTSFTMTGETMTDVSIVMAPVETQTCSLPANPKWQSTGILASPHPDGSHDIVSVKDPTIQKYNGKYLIYCTVFNKSDKAAGNEGTFQMQFIEFTDLNKADDATPYFMTQTSGFSGYKCAPELFYFEPQDLWYLIWQQQEPAYSTTKTPDKPDSWSAPKSFVSNWESSWKPLTKPEFEWGTIDYWPIADDKNFYLFMTGDDGAVYRSKTTLANFPNGFSTPVIAKSFKGQRDVIFEGGSHYKIKGTTNTYFHMVEGMGSTGRYYSAWTSDGLEGEWKDYKAGQSTPFMRSTNVTYVSGAKDWTNDVSHGEFIRDNPNQYMELDLCNLRFLYQGLDPGAENVSYNLKPYRLGLLTVQ